MATVRKTITLTDRQDDWIKARVERGDYTNDSEYIRDLIRREQERGLEIESVRAALLEGEKSGTPKRWPGASISAWIGRTSSYLPSNSSASRLRGRRVASISLRIPVLNRTSGSGAPDWQVAHRGQVSFPEAGSISESRVVRGRVGRLWIPLIDPDYSL